MSIFQKSRLHRISQYSAKGAVAAILGVAIGTCTLPPACAQGSDASFIELQHDWEVATFQSPVGDRVSLFGRLAAKAEAVHAVFPGRAEPLIWQAMALSAQADALGWLGTWTRYKLGRQARDLFEIALSIDPDALDGAAYIGLGGLYCREPRWPLGLGDKAAASQLLQKALELQPEGVVSNFSYGACLATTQKNAQAAVYLRKAASADVRPGYQVADTGIKEEARQLLVQLNIAAIGPSR